MNYSLKKIVESLPVKKNSNSSWWVKLWVRKASFPFTWLFINIGFSPNAVSVLSIAFVMAACAGYVISTPATIITAVVLINVWLVLDCVDGNIARCRKQKTIYGEFVDDIGGYFVVAFIYLAIAFCVYNMGGLLVEEGNKWMLAAGGVASICDILARLINKDYVNFSKNRSDYVQDDYRTESKKSLSYVRRRVGKELGVSGLFMPLTIVCAFWHCYDLLVLFYLLFNGFALLSTTIIYIYKADKYDRTHSVQ